MTRLHNQTWNSDVNHEGIVRENTLFTWRWWATRRHETEETKTGTEDRGERPSLRSPQTWKFRPWMLRNFRSSISVFDRWKPSSHICNPLEIRLYLLRNESLYFQERHSVSWLDYLWQISSQTWGCWPWRQSVKHWKFQEMAASATKSPLYAHWCDERALGVCCKILFVASDFLVTISAACHNIWLGKWSCPHFVKHMRVYLKTIVSYDHGFPGINSFCDCLERIALRFYHETCNERN